MSKGINLEGKRNLRELARKAQADESVLPILGDAVLEAGIVLAGHDVSLEEGRPWKPDNSRSWKTPEEAKVLPSKPDKSLPKMVLDQIAEDEEIPEFNGVATSSTEMEEARNGDRSDE